MRISPWRTGMLIAPIVLASGITLGKPAAAIPILASRDNGPDQAADSRQSPLPQGDLLKKLALRVGGALRHEHLLMKPFHDEEGGGATEYHARPEKLHIPDRNGKSHLYEMVVPAADGLHLTLQLQDGKVVTAAVRPQELPNQYRTQAGPTVKWTTHLDSFWLDTAHVTLLVNLDYGKKVKPEVVSKIVAIVAESIKEINGSVKNPQGP